MKRTGKRLAAVLFCLLLLAMQLTPVLAVEQIDPTQTGSLTIQCKAQEQPIAGMALSIWQAATVDHYGAYTLTAAFESSGTAVNGLETAQQWRQAAAALAAYASEQQLPALAEQTTGQDGTALFSALEPGLYLVTAAETVTDTMRYTAEPFLVSVPNREGDSDTWDYDASAAPKIQGTVIEQPSPSPAPSESPEPSPAPSGSPTPAVSPVPSAAPAVSPTPTPADSLPQTGQLRWPIPVLAILGMLLVLIGCVVRRRRNG